MLKVLNKNTNGLKIEYVEITPDIARSWLDTNQNNRRINKRFVSQFVQDMKSGNWQITGDAIRFDSNGTLIDGQHRLRACIEAGASFPSYVMYGLDPSSKEVIDTGKARSARDVLSMRGLTNSGAIATALKIIVIEKSGGAGEAKGLTHTVITETLEKHPALPLWVPVPGTFPNGISVPLVGYVAYVNGHLLNHKSRAHAMVNVLKTGEPDYEGDPIHKYREKIIRSREESVASIRTRRSVLWTFKYCWNLFLKRKPLERLQWAREDVDLIGLDKDLL